MVHLSQDTPHIHAGASMLNITNSGQNIVAAEGSCARFLDTGTARASTYGVEISSTNNCALHLTAGATGASNLLVTPYAAATVSAVTIGGGADWDGADNIGMLHVNSDTALIAAGATNLFVGHATAQPISGAEGHLARFISTGTARTDAYGVEIAVSTTEGALHVSAGHSLFAEKVTFTAGQQSSAVALTATSSTGVATPAGTTFVNVTCDTSSKIVDLPVPVLGNIVYYLANSTTAFELAPQADTQYINATLCGSAKSLECAASGVMYRATCTVGGDSGKWVIEEISAAGVLNTSGGGTPN